MDNTRPTVIPETDYRYVDKSSGRELTFSPKPNEAMVTFHGPADEGDLRAVLMDPTILSIGEGYNLVSGFVAVNVRPEHDMDAARASLASRPEVANSMPVMIDAYGASRYFLPDEFTAQFKPGIDKTRAEQIIKDHGSSILVEQRTPGYYTLAVPQGRGLFQTIREFSELDEVAFAEPSEVGFNSADYSPGNPNFVKLWGLQNTGQKVNGATGIPGVDIKCTNAWDVTRGHPDIIIAVIDYGADLDHVDLQSNLLPRGSENWNFADVNDPVPEEPFVHGGHGTHVAGTAAAAENDMGVIGVAPKCRFMPLRVDLSAGKNQNRADAINCVTWHASAYPNRRYIINCSWGMSGDLAAVRTAIQNAVSSNVIVVAAAGNDNRSTDKCPHYPSNYPEVIAVAALRSNNVKWQNSNYGSTVDVAAPGQNIWSSVLDNKRRFRSGTSMAAPHVAGVAALVWSRDPGLTNHQVRNIIESTCDLIDADNPKFAGMLGHGRVNAFSALSST
jgi:subtilisin family serine protease